MMTLYNSLVARLKNRSETIEDIIGEVEIESLDKQPQFDTGRIKHNIAHLSRFKHVFIECFN